MRGIDDNRSRRLDRSDRKRLGGAAAPGGRRPTLHSADSSAAPKHKQRRHRIGGMARERLRSSGRTAIAIAKVAPRIAAQARRDPADITPSTDIPSINGRCELKVRPGFPAQSATFLIQIFINICLRNLFLFTASVEAVQRPKTSAGSGDATGLNGLLITYPGLRQTNSKEQTMRVAICLADRPSFPPSPRAWPVN